ncbi:hypothetical protein M422DRAFT_275301 [Sphaerobolus stellatus SS14]|uniref:Uncharacterized protein n=1 Tax=Sphaerobolus stellatus (strain SS14) TaxID=990650 RepID=A0A0C9UEY8_SPHS4|nr:hypothetical protein M422DRAFT_275301 [Sphaerobolus stellatus SS14]
MFSLRPSKSERCLRKLRKQKPSTLSWSPVLQPSPETDFVAFHNPSPVSLPSRRPRRISRNARRDTILIDLTKNDDLMPALDYAFALIDSDAENASESDPLTPTSTSFSVATPPVSIRSAPPRYYYASSRASPIMTRRGTADSDHISQFRPSAVDPLELSTALSHVDYRPPQALPFPPSPPRSPKRVPLLKRKPRLAHSSESSTDGHDFTNYPGLSNISLIRSVSSLDHHSRDRFYSGACQSTASVNTTDSGFANRLARGLSLHRSSSSSLRFFTPKKNRTSRASTPPPLTPLRLYPASAGTQHLRADDRVSDAFSL